MRFLLTFLICFVTVAVNALAPVKWNQRYQDYINMYKDVAIYEMLHHNIPASITLAQGLLESGAGHSDLSVKGNNHFGIKCHDWVGPTMHHDDDERGECFRVYNSPFESFEDHSLFLKRARYKSLFSLKRTDYVGWARGLKSCGYATNPKYAQLLIDIIRCYGLDKYDHATMYDESNFRRQAGSGFGNMPLPDAELIGVTHSVRANNKNFYVVARRGDTFKSIAKEFGMSYRKLAKYNERDKKTVLKEGDIVYFEKKRKKADKAFKKVLHTVQPGESMYSISQKYGIRLKYLYKKNKLSVDDEVHVGDKLRVY